MERRIYVRDPIQEAICEFKFRSPTDGWTLYPGQLYERVSGSYSVEPSTEVGIPAAMMPPPGGMAAAAGVIPPMGNLHAVFGPMFAAVTQLTTPDRHYSIRMGQRSMSIHLAAPYSQWEAFLSEIERAIGAFSEIVNGQFDVERIGVRYVNRIEFSEPTVALAEYFRLSPLQFDGFDYKLTSFLARTEQARPSDEHQRLIATFASVAAPPGQCAFVLDLDSIAQDLEDVNTVEAALRLADELKSIEHDVFEASITDKTREHFGGVVES